MSRGQIVKGLPNFESLGGDRGLRSSDDVASPYGAPVDFRENHAKAGLAGVLGSPASAVFAALAAAGGTVCTDSSGNLRVKPRHVGERLANEISLHKGAMVAELLMAQWVVLDMKCPVVIGGLAGPGGNDLPVDLRLRVADAWGACVDGVRHGDADIVREGIAKLEKIRDLVGTIERQREKGGEE